MTTKTEDPEVFDRAAEEGLIGSVLIYPEVALVEASALVSADDFYIHRLRWIWKTFVRLRDRGQAIDIVTVASELQQVGKLEEIGGAAYLTALLNQTPNSTHAESYAEIVATYAFRRRALKAANELATIAYSGEAATLAGSAQDIFNHLMLSDGGKRDLVSLGEVASRLYDAAEERAKLHAQGLPYGIPRIPTGLIDLDNLLGGGVGNGRLIVVAGRPGQGKTSLLMTIMSNAYNVGKKKIGVFSLEMPDEELTGRHLAAETHIDANTLTEGILEGEQWTTFTNTLDSIFTGEGAVFIGDAASLTPSTLRAQAHRLKARHGLDMIIVDYIQLMRSRTKTYNREQEVAHISRELKLLARELNIPVIVAAQLSRAVEARSDKEPWLSDLRESGAIENDADVVIFIWRPEGEIDKNLTHGKVAKQRNGPTGYFDLFFNARLTKFESLTRTKVSFGEK